MNTIFNTFPWHDATIEYININRQNPGEEDIIKLFIDWPDGRGSSIIEFHDCYALEMNMNFGVVASETILQAECCDVSDELNSIRNKWLKVGVNLEDLKCFKIITNSTNSNIFVYALSFQVVNL